MHVLPLDKHSASSCTARHKLQRGVAAPAGPCLPQEQRKQQQSRHRCVTLAAVDASKLLVLASTPQEYFPAAVGFGVLHACMHTTHAVRHQVQLMLWRIIVTASMICIL